MKTYAKTKTKKNIVCLQLRDLKPPTPQDATTSRLQDPKSSRPRDYKIATPRPQDFSMKRNETKRKQKKNEKAKNKKKVPSGVKTKGRLRNSMSRMTVPSGTSEMKKAEIPVLNFLDVSKIVGRP